MPSFEYTCICGARLTTTSREPPRCPADGLTMNRVWSFQGVWRRGFEPHFNNSVGTVVHNQAQFKSELHRKGDEMSERMGFAHQYEPVDIRDKEACGVDDAGADAIEKRYGKAN